MRAFTLSIAAASAAGLAIIAAPQPFAPGIVSTGHEFTVTFTPGGGEVYFTRYSLSPRENHVMHSTFANGAWQPALPVEFSGDWADLDPSLSPDGTRLYFISTRPRPGQIARPDKPTPPDMDIWYADRAGDRWGAPHWIEELSSNAKEGSPTVDRQGTLCFFSDRGDAANNNAIYCAARNGTGWSAPTRLSANVNAGPSDTSPFLSPDGNTLLFYSTRPGGAGKADLYISHKRGGEWQRADNLGPVVNGPDSEYNPSVSRDGASLYFGRNGGIYVVPLAELDARLISPAMFK